MKRRQRGFTLIELAIVLVVLTILAGGLLVPLTKQIEVERIRSTQQIMEDAKQALIGFAMSRICTCSYDSLGNLLSSVSTCTSCPLTGASSSSFSRHYLPCPDKMTSPNPTSNLPNDGIEDRKPSGGCEVQEGNFPWATLGVANADAWGNRLRYRVTTDFTGASTGDFADSSKGFNNTTKIKLADQLQVCTPPTCTQIVDDGGGVEGIPVISAIIVSHGPNGWGAMNSNGVFQHAPISTNELENTNGDREFISLPPSIKSDTTTEFDDLVVWLSTDVLLSRVCPSGGCL